MNPLLPLNIYINRKHLKKQLYLYIVILVGCIICFWYASGKFFTEDYYYPKTTLLMPFFIILFIIGVFVQIKTINRKEPIITLDNEGIQYFWMKLPPVKWAEISIVEERIVNNEKHLTILVKDIQAYAERISSPRLKEKYKKRIDKTGNNIAFSIDLSMLNYNPAEFVRIIRQMTTESENNKGFK